MLPAPLDDDTGLSARQVTKARRDYANAALEVFRHGLDARTQSEKDRLDSQSISDASRAALDEELDLLDYGLARAGGSAAKTELVARHIERMAAINDRRITRRFGG